MIFHFISYFVRFRRKMENKISLKVRDARKRFEVLLKETNTHLAEKERQAQSLKLAKEEELRKVRNLEEAQLLLREQAEKERLLLRNTKEYFNLNNAQRKIVPKLAPCYFGENNNCHEGWEPHGSGKFYVAG